MMRSSIAAVLFMVVTRAAAHETWLIPEQFAVTPGATVNFDLTSGTGFPGLDTTVEAGRVTKAACRVARHSTDITTLTPAEHSLRLATTVADPGIATVGVDLAPRRIELQPKEVEEYLDEIGASELVKQRWALSDTKRWREEYNKHAKTFVRVGDAATDRSWSEPVGMFLEIVPQSDPTKLVAGSDLTVLVLREGSTIPGFSVGLIREGGAREQMQKTDAGGAATLHLDAAGRWLLYGTLMRAMPGPDLDWESHFTTLTVEVSAAP